MAKRHIAARHEESAVEPELVRSDEGILIARLDTTTCVNHATDQFDARRPRLHVDGRSFAHVGEDAKGRWIYRYDK